MDDPIEKYAREHRDAFDDFEPGPGVWEGISREMGWKKSRAVQPYAHLWKAAAVFFLLLSSWLLIDRYASTREANGLAEETLVSAGGIGEVEQFYIALISEKTEQLRIASQGHDALRNDFLAELQQLDSMYQLLKKDLATGNEAEIADAMVLNLQMRIDLLNRQLSILQNALKAEKHENYSL